MTPDSDRLYNLLPIIYRQRDNGGPLKALLSVITEQVQVVDQDITQLYDNWFIETCQDWAVPYLGDLIGYQPPTPASLPDDLTSADSRALESTLTPRREVANTLFFRERKGTLGILAQLARDLTGWPAHAVELDGPLATTQPLNYPRPRRGGWIDLRARHVLDRLNGAFDHAARTVTLRPSGLHAARQCDVLPSVGVFVWRLKIYALEHVPAFCVQPEGSRCFTFSALGYDAPLFARDNTGAATNEESFFPGPISRGAFTHVALRERHRERIHASKSYYGVGKSVVIWAPNWCGLDDQSPVPAERVIPADLSQWRYEPPPGHVAVDPKLGRIAFAPAESPKDGVWVSYCYGFGDDIGGGPYSRGLSYPPNVPVYFVGSGAQYPSLGLALAAWRTDLPTSSIIEFVDSEVYTEPIRITLAANQSLEIRASNGARPVLNIVGPNTNRPEAMTVTGASGSALRMNGLIIRGRALEISGALAHFHLSDSTLGGEPSLVVLNTAVHISIRRSIVGAIRVIRTEPDISPSECLIERSIVDGLGPEASAIAGEDGRVAGLIATIRNTTILGGTTLHAIALAENTIFTGTVRVARRQTGCIRFCYLPLDSRTPSRYRCQPDSRQQESELKPEFVSTRYGDPQYGQLADTCAEQIRRGAEDGSQLGVFHDLFEPQRLDMLVAAVADFVPFGTQAGVICVD